LEGHRDALAYIGVLGLGIGDALVCLLLFPFLEVKMDRELIPGINSWKKIWEDKMES
jgi:hypothetical protein